MARIKKKGALQSPRNLANLLRHVRHRQELHHPSAGCAQAADFRSRISDACASSKVIRHFVHLHRAGSSSPAGIYPREPRKRKKVAKGTTPTTTFYYTKDIQYLLHEPLIAKFREHKAVARKIARALGRGEAGDAVRLEKTLIPKVKLDHIIKERYPTFVDALRDLDDALSMVFLFANLPSTTAVPSRTIALCQRLCFEFQHYLIVSHSLRKSFLSIKGIYYQATIQGQDILWLVPYKFVQRTGGDIDFRIMGTFIELYTTLLGFVNFRLYTSVGLVYPPKFDVASDDRGGEMSAFELHGKELGREQTAVTHAEDEAPPSASAQAEADKVASLAEAEDNAGDGTAPAQAEENAEAIDAFEPAAQDADVLPQPLATGREAAALFSHFTFYLSRETPRGPLEFLLKAFGCKRVGWDSILGDGAFTTNESDPAITHQVVDRPPLPPESLPPVAEPTASEAQNGDSAPAAHWPRSTMPGRTYVQPQWVWDCINQAKLLRPDLYAPGAMLPPHLSPWVQPKKGHYDPNLPLEEQEPAGEADAFHEAADEAEMPAEEAEEQPQAAETEFTDASRSSSVEAGEGMDVAAASSSDEADGADVVADDSSFNGLSDPEENASSDEADAAQRQHQRELEAEAQGVPVDAAALDPRADARRQAQKQRKAARDELERRKMMLPQRKRKLLTRIEFGAAKRDKEAEVLRLKRRKLEKARNSAEKS